MIAERDDYIIITINTNSDDFIEIESNTNICNIVDFCDKKCEKCILIPCG